MPKGAGDAEALEVPAAGPFPARIESLETQPAFRAQTTSEDPGAAKAVYTTDFDFNSAGEWRIAALIDQGGKLDGIAAAERDRRRLTGRAPRRPEGAPDPHADRR